MTSSAVRPCQCWGCKAGDGEAGVSPLRGSEIRPGSAARHPGTSHYARPARPALHYTHSVSEELRTPPHPDTSRDMSRYV